MTLTTPPSYPAPLTLHPRSVLTLLQVRAVSLLGLVHTLGNLLTNMSLGAVAVSFTHTIKVTL